MRLCPRHLIDIAFVVLGLHYEIRALSGWNVTIVFIESFLNILISCEIS